MWKKVLIILGAGCCVALLVFMVMPTRHSILPLQFWAVKFLTDGKTLVTVGGKTKPAEKPRSGELIFWNIATGKKDRIILQNSGIRSVDVSPNGKVLVTGDFDGDAKLLDPATGKILANLPRRSKAVNAVAISADCKLVVIGDLDGNVTLWNSDTKQVKMVSIPKAEILNVAISPNQSMVVATTRTGKAFLFDPRKSDLPMTELRATDGKPGYTASVEAVAFSPDGLTLATGCKTALKLWETKTGKLIRRLKESTPDTEGTTNTNTDAAASLEKENTLATTASDAPETNDVPSKDEPARTTHAAHELRLNSFAFSKDGTVLAAVDTGGTLALWNVATGKLIKSVLAHHGACYSVCFSPDFERIATVGRSDFNVKIWDAKTLDPISTFARTGPHR